MAEKTLRKTTPETRRPSAPAASIGDPPQRTQPTVALTIAGFDPSNGAGVTADLEVFAAHGVFGISAITALTVQSTAGVAAVHLLSAEWLSQTLDHLQTDLPAAGVKIGMLGSAEAVHTVADFLRAAHGLSGSFGRRRPIVLDPVLRFSSGHELLPASALEALHAELLPLVGWITPNHAELALLSGREVANLAQARAAADALAYRYPHLTVVATGGDCAQPIDLLRTSEGRFTEFRGERIETSSTHGTGCAFSSALLARLLLRDEPVHAVAAAKAYVTEALRSAPGLGHGNGPLDLLWPLRRKGSPGC